MKRIINCPKCEAKLAVFDIGKPINQKCPKCGNAFVVESEDKKTEEVKTLTAEAAKEQPASAAPEATAAAAPAPKDDKAAAATAPAKDQTTPSKKEGKKKTAPLPETPATTPAAPAVTPAPAAEEKKDAEPAAAAAPADDKKDASPKEIKVKKPEESPAFASKARTPVKSGPAPSDTAAATELPAVGGHSPLFNALVVGLLLIIIVLQAFAKIQSNKQYGKLIEHLQFIETKLGK